MGFFIVVLGLFIGSYLNVLIYRLPLGLSTSKGRSYCPSCNHTLSWICLIPLFSYIFLRGKCRYCRSSIPIKYPLVELGNALIWLLLFLRYDVSLSFFLYAVSCSSLLALAVIDSKVKYIPDRFNVVIGISGLFFLIFVGEIPWYSRIIGFFALSLPLFILAATTGGVGEGDVKLFAVCGLLLGWQRILLAFFISAVSAAIFAGILMSKGKANRKSELAFGPFIAIGTILSVLFGDAVINAYLSLIFKY